MPRGRGKEIVVSYETLTKTSLLVDFFIFLNNNSGFDLLPLPRMPRKSFPLPQDV